MKDKERRVKNSTALLIQNKNIKLNFRQKGKLKNLKKLEKLKPYAL